MQMIDTHAHIYLREFTADREEMLARALKTKVEVILMPAIDAATHEAMIELGRYDNKCKPMMGLHPCSVKEDYQKELDIVKEYLSSESFVGVGEIGLDFFWDNTFINEQILVFRQQLEWALEQGLPVSIHSRNATAECINVVKDYKGLRGVFHCFSGTYEQAAEITEIGLYLGIGGVVTFKNSGLDKVLEKIDLKHLVLETDAPYLAPVPFRGKRNEPSYLNYIVSRLALIYKNSVEEIGISTTNNARELFKL